MLTEVVDKILSLAPIQTAEIDGQTYLKADQKIHRLRAPAQHPPAALTFATLGGLAEYVVANDDGLNLEEIILHVVDFNRVDLLGRLQPTNDNIRFCHAAAVCSRPAFRWGQWMAIEDFIIALQSDFAEVEGEPDDVDGIIDMLGKVASEHVRTTEDDGFSQMLQVRTGLTTRANVKVENPVKVHPWRTFPEVKQPLTLAVLRFRNIENQAPRVALFESGGESWRYAAIAAIREWLAEVFPETTILA